MKLLGNRVLIKHLDSGENKTAGGIILSASETTFTTAEVLAVGDDEEVTKRNLKVGDKVAVPRQEGFDIEIEGQKFLCVGIQHIIAIL